MKFLRRTLMLCLATVCMSALAVGQTAELRVPQTVKAGKAFSVPTTGSGKATFYLAGPGESSKQEVNLGQAIQLTELQNAGRYVAILCADSCRNVSFFVVPAGIAKLSFLVHPSRAAVGLSDVISGVAFPFDAFHNIVLDPASINFKLTANGAELMSRSIPTQHGVAWFRTNSSTRAGVSEITASLGALSVRRAVQQVASEPCNLHINGRRTDKGVLVETDPVHDCAGNQIPDGTIVTFTASAGDGKSTIDVPVKQGIARAQFVESGATVVSVASGVVMGNELRVGQ